MTDPVGLTPRMAKGSSVSTRNASFFGSSHAVCRSHPTGPSLLRSHVVLHRPRTGPLNRSCCGGSRRALRDRLASPSQEVHDNFGNVMGIRPRSVVAESVKND